MKISMKILVIMLSFIFTVFFTVQAFGMEMTAEEKELWKRIENFFEAWVHGDRKKLPDLHENYLNWSSSRENPMGKDDYINMIIYIPIESYTSELVKISTAGNFCLLMYNWSIKGPWGSNKGRSVAAYMKQDGKWHAMGGFSASCRNPAVCRP